MADLIVKECSMNKITKFFLIVMLIYSIAGCSGSAKLKVPAPIPDDLINISEPQEQAVNIAKEALHNQFFIQIQKLFEPSRLVRKLAGKPKQAMNIDAFGEVHNSTWFTNRNSI